MRVVHMTLFLKDDNLRNIKTELSKVVLLVGKVVNITEMFDSLLIAKEPKKRPSDQQSQHPFQDFKYPNEPTKVEDKREGYARTKS